jgi:hypothetical protein
LRWSWCSLSLVALLFVSLQQQEQQALGREPCLFATHAFARDMTGSMNLAHNPCSTTTHYC